MHDMNLEKNRSKIQTAYKVSPFTKGTCPEPEDAVKRFESRYTPIPAEYRWLLLNFGGCYLAEPWIFTLKELEEAYPIFQEAYEDYMSEYDHGPTFPIGGLGDGSIVFIDLESGRVRGYNCDYADLEEIAENFSSLLLGLVEQALEPIPNGSSASAAGPQPPMRVRPSGSLPHICQNVRAARKSKT